MVRRILFPIAAATLVLSGPAYAQTASGDALRAAVLPARSEAPRVHLAAPPSVDSAAYALRRAGIAQTSVDRRLASDDLMGSLGFLCGLQPGAERSGAAAARGVDPTGRFVGAKLRLAFR